MLKHRFLLLFLLLFTASLFAQKKADSTDYYTAKVTSLVQKMSESESKVNIGLGYGKLAIEFARRSKNSFLLGLAYRKIGNYYLEQLNNYSKAYEYYCLAVNVYEKINYQMGVAGCYNNIGNIYIDKASFTNENSEYKEAIRYHLMALKIRMKNGDKRVLAQSYLNIGNIYSNTGDLWQAREYYGNALKLYMASKVSDGVNLCLLSLADLYMKEARKSGARQDYEKAGVAYAEFLKNYLSAHITDESRYVQYTLGMAQIHLKLGDKSKALSFGEEAMQKARELHDFEDLKGSCLFLNEYYEQSGNYALALANYKKYVAIRDSLTNSKSTRNLISLQALHESDQKENEIELLKRDKSIKDLELLKQKNQVNAQRTISFISFISIALVVLLALVIYKRYRLKKVANESLAKAYELIEGKNKHITDSINYAKRIQDAILPTETELQKWFSDAFVFFRPKAIVSGDFFWFTHKNDQCVLAVADCTGHGVPGAFMSIIGNTLLNEIVNEKQVFSPVAILEQLNKGVSKMLNQEAEGIYTQDDGMDISICAIDLSTREIRFAGANQSMLIVQSGKAELIEGELFSIGGMFARKEFRYSEKTIHAEKDSRIYLFTDGFQDQFGEAENKKFLSSRFEELLKETAKLDMKDQKKAIEGSFDNWKGGGDQIDDVLVVGLKL